MITLTESERHAVAHAKFMVRQATPENPDVCFDYELVASLVNLIERLGNHWKIDPEREE